ncbi:MAG: rhodanese-like domain-containing protein [Firmicutes bacterium]|nr:rhodanese-like domain-containing protein [Bacillota bacterium]
MKTITPTELQSKLESGEQVNLIDVRETEEVAAGMIPGAEHIPLGSIEFKHQDLDKSKEYIMICRSGNRSGQACQFLEEEGYNVTNMSGGMLEWEGEVK